MPSLGAMLPRTGRAAVLDPLAQRRPFMMRCSTIALFLLLAAASLQAGTAARELFRDSFEDPATTGWQHTWGQFEISAERAHEGKHSLKETLEDRYGYSVHYRDLPAEFGDTFTFAAWVFIPSAQPKRPVARLSINTTRWATLATATTDKLDQWVRLSATYVNDEHENLRFELMQAKEHAGMGGAVMFWDSVTCTVKPGDKRMKPAKLANPFVIKGLTIKPAGGLSITVAPGKCRVDRGIVAVTKPVTLTLDPVTVHPVRNERTRLTTDKPQGWARGTRLKACIGAGVTLPGRLVPGSVVVKPEPDGKPYTLGKDYLLDETWAMLGRVEGGAIGARTMVYVDYAYSLARLDTVQVSPAGEVSLRKGVELKTCPHPAGATGGCLALANVFVDYNATKLTAKDIFPIGPPLAAPTHGELANKAARVPKTRQTLADGGTLRIGFWGDSVTCGGDASRPQYRFPDGFVLALRKRYPKATIDFFNAGIGGSSTSGRLPNLDKDVIQKKPDLVIIEFVNDMGYSPKTMRDHYYKAIAQVRAIGGEVILVTPHFTMPSMMGFADVWGKGKRSACGALRKIAEEKQVGLADAARVWQHLAKMGLPYTTLLFNGINHPDDRGHRIFIDELLTFF